MIRRKNMKQYLHQ